MGEFYIWYIVGGVSLFFVVLGFVADKSGLAKKTFSKEPKKSDGNIMNSEQNGVVQDNIVYQPIVPEGVVTDNQQQVVTDSVNYGANVVNAFEDDMSMANESLYIADDSQYDNNNVTSGEQEQNYVDVTDDNEVAGDVEQTSLVEDAVVYEDSDNVWTPDENVEVVADVPAELENAENAAFMLDGEEVADTGVVSTDETEDVNEEIPVELETSEDAAFTLDGEEVVDTSVASTDETQDVNEVSPVALESSEDAELEEVVNADIAADDAQSEWGVDATVENNTSDVMDAELPDLADIAENSEDDVWKF